MTFFIDKYYRYVQRVHSQIRVHIKRGNIYNIPHRFILMICSEIALIAYRGGKIEVMLEILHIDEYYMFRDCTLSFRTIHFCSTLKLK